MFDTILLRRNRNINGFFDCGQMIENLFFYDKTVVHLTRSDVLDIYKLADVDVLVELFQKPYIDIYYNNSQSGIMSSDDVHTLDTIGLSDLDLEKIFYEHAFAHDKDKIRCSKFSKKLSRIIKPYQLPKDFNKVLLEQVQDNEFRKNVLIETIDNYTPNHGINTKQLEYDLEWLDKQNFKIHSNLDFRNQTSITPTSGILSLINACEDMHVMGEYKSEISLPEFNSRIIRLKADGLVNKVNRNIREIEVFNHFVFDESWALREAINKKKIHVKAILDTLDKASRFKGWLKNLDQDANLMREYLIKVEEKSILEWLPLRAIRFYFFNGLSAILGYTNPEVGIPLSIGLNAFDSFLVEKMSQKWKPNQFVEGEYRPLVKGRSA